MKYVNIDNLDLIQVKNYKLYMRYLCKCGDSAAIEGIAISITLEAQPDKGDIKCKLEILRIKPTLPCEKSDVFCCFGRVSSFVYGKQTPLS